MRRQSDPPKKSAAETPPVDTSQTVSQKAPLNENKTSAAKQKLLNENLTGKKLAASLNGTIYTDHLLGYNGTGQRKDYNIVSIKPGAEPTTVPTVVQSGSSSNVSIESVASGDGKSKLIARLFSAADIGNGNVSMTTTTVDPLSAAINIDTVEQPESELNATLQNYNITKTQEDYHTYYNSVWTTDKNASDAYWKRLDNMNVSSLLSNSHRRATVG